MKRSFFDKKSQNEKSVFFSLAFPRNDKTRAGEVKKTKEREKVRKGMDGGEIFSS